MAWHTTLVAMSLQQGCYAVFATNFLGGVDVIRMEREGLLRDASDPRSGYSDRLAVLTPVQLEGYAVTSNSRKWLQELPSEVIAVLVHQYEWESGLGD
jgi:hypothetical protein